jgi:hypothetical protein
LAAPSAHSKGLSAQKSFRLKSAQNRPLSKADPAACIGLTVIFVPWFVSSGITPRTRQMTGMAAEFVARPQNIGPSRRVDEKRAPT